MAREAVIKGVLSDEGVPLKIWEMPCQTDFPKLIEAITCIKQNVNEYLTQLVNQERKNTLKNQMNVEELSELEEELEEDDVTEFIKSMNIIKKRSAKGGKKELYLKQAKKIKKS